MEKRLKDPANWACEPVGQECATLTHMDPMPNNVCQIKLRATDLVSMPDGIDLVWYPGGLGTTIPTAAEGLYLALLNMKQTDKLSDLCSANSSSTFRAFVKVAE